MADRTVKVSLIAEVNNYISGMQQAQQATQKTSTEAEKLAAKRQSMDVLAKGAIAFGTAVTAVGLAAMKTGVQYNTLQQTSRAALTTLLGSAKAANEQMDKLDEFATTSPFAKQVFIRAQQQMLAFGIATENVLPYLDAVQQAVAAMGGSNDDIAALAQIFGKIKSSAKITAVDLMQFGKRGVDAAKLIGDAMGKTAGEIRSEITAGSLDADDALAALAQGMQDRFGGATDNVKKTFAGAVDRMKAAWRDFSADLAEPLVGKNGGGALVELFNWTADMMRAFMKLPEPVKLTAGALTGLVGVVSLLGGTAVLALPKIVAFRVAVETLKTQSPLAARAVGKLSGALRTLGAAAVVGVAITGVESLSSTLADKLLPAAEQTSNAVKTAKTGVELMQAALKATGMHGSVNGAKKNLGELAGALDDMASGGVKAGAAYQGMGTVIRALDTSLGAMDLDSASAAFQTLAKDAKLSTDEQKELINQSPTFKSALTEQATSLEVSATNTNLLKIATGELKAETKDAADAQDAASGSASGYSAAVDAAGKSTEDAAKAQEAWKKAVSDASQSFIDIGGAYDDLVQQNEDVKTSTETATKSGSQSWEDFYNDSKVSIDKWLTELENQVSAQENWQKNMVRLAGRVSADTLTELGKLGPEGAPLVAQLVDASDDELSRLDGVMKSRSQEGSDAFADTLDQAKPVIAAVAEKYGKKAADKVAEALVKGKETIATVMTKYDLEIEGHKPELKIDVDPATRQINSFIGRQNGRTITVNVRAAQVQANSLNHILHGRASGGIIPGPPSSKDNMLIHAASGEYVVNAAMTAKHRGLLEAINSGTLGAFKNGGFVQPQYAQPRYVPTTPNVTVEGMSRPNVNIELVNPVMRDPVEDVRRMREMAVMSAGS